MALPVSPQEPPEREHSDGQGHCSRPLFLQATALPSPGRGVMRVCFPLASRAPLTPFPPIPRPRQGRSSSARHLVGEPGSQCEVSSWQTPLQFSIAVWQDSPTFGGVKRQLRGTVAGCRSAGRVWLGASPRGCPRGFGQRRAAAVSWKLRWAGHSGRPPKPARRRCLPARARLVGSRESLQRRPLHAARATHSVVAPFRDSGP